MNDLKSRLSECLIFYFEFAFLENISGAIYAMDLIVLARGYDSVPIGQNL